MYFVTYLLILKLLELSKDELSCLKNYPIKGDTDKKQDGDRDARELYFGFSSPMGVILWVSGCRCAIKKAKKKKKKKELTSLIWICHNREPSSRVPNFIATEVGAYRTAMSS